MPYKPHAAVIADNPPFYKGDIVDYVYGRHTLRRLSSLTEMHPHRLYASDLNDQIDRLTEVEVLFTTWGMPRLLERDLDQLPNLRAVFYAAGCAADFSEPLQARGIEVFTAIEANSIPVAEFTLAQALLSLKGVHRNARACRQGPWVQRDMPVGPGSYGESVALLGVGVVGRLVIKLLGPFAVRVMASDVCLRDQPDLARRLGIDEVVEFDEAFARSMVVSNHLSDHSENKKVLRQEHFASMREGATFINTGRGAQVDEAGLASVLQQREDLTAILDVQHPEPPLADSPLYTLPNVILTSHIAGSVEDEVRRMSDYILREFIGWRDRQTDTQQPSTPSIDPSFLGPRKPKGADLSLQP
ncbi:MAG: hydroxyacid dehydrogenase [Planctomycetota bacterium]